MGHPKPLLPWQDGTLIGFQVRALADADIFQIIVVLGHAAEQVAPHVRGHSDIKMLINPHYLQGKTTSIKAGLGEVDHQASAILLLAVDQPRPTDLLLHLLQEHHTQGALITQPVYQDKGGHPLLFHTSLLPELREISEERQGIREVMERDPARVNRVPVESPVVLLDINTRKEYRQAQELFRQATV